MGLPDVLSDDEMSQLEGGGSPALPTFSGGLPDIISNDDMTALEAFSARSRKPSTGWDVPGMITQGLSGAAKGFTSTLGMLGDVGNILTGNFSRNIDPATGDFSMFPSLNLMQQGQAAILPAEDPNHRYAHTVGEFVGGQGPLSIFSKAAMAPRAISEALGGALGAQSFEDVFKNDTVAPLAGAVLGAGGTSALIDGASALRSIFRPATADEITGSAKLAMEQATGLKPYDIAEGIIANPNDELSTLRSTAELTNNAGMAQLEKQLGATTTAANKYAVRGAMREDARKALVDGMSSVEGVNKEGLGSDLIAAGHDRYGLMKEGEDNLWQLLDRNVGIDIGEEQAGVASILSDWRANTGPKGDGAAIIKQFLGADTGRLDSGTLQDIRSEALRILRDGSNIGRVEQRALAAIAGGDEGMGGGIDQAMERGFAALRGEPEKYAAWTKARAATKEKVDTFARGTAGGALLEPMARPDQVLANAIKGDSRSIKQLKAAIGERPELIERVKRGFLDSIPRDADDQITRSAMKKFLAANEGSIRELLGEKHLTSMRNILADLRSEARVQKIADFASRGNSVTSQKETVAGVLDDLLSESLLPGTSMIASMANGVRKVLGINNKQQVADMLFRAALEPSFALHLSLAPTEARVFKALERFQMAGRNLVQASGRSGALELGTQTNDESNLAPPRSGQAPASLLGKGAPVGNGNLVSGQPPLLSPGPQPSAQGNQTASPALGQLGPGGQLQQSSFTQDASIFSKDQSLSEPSVFAKLSKAVEKIESGGKADAVSNKGAVGTHQVRPIAMREVMRRQGIDDSALTDADLTAMAKRPGVSKRFGEAYLQMLVDQYDGDVELALAAYNAGPTLVDRLLKGDADTFADIRGKLPAETQAYVPKVRSVFEKI